MTETKSWMDFLPVLKWLWFEMKKILIVLLTFFQISTCLATPALYGLASVIPGLGQALRGQYMEGLGWFASSLSLMSTGDFKLQMIGQNIWFYNIYDAWRDAGGSPSINAPVFVDYAQNFNPVHLTDPFALGFIGGAALNRSSVRRELQDKNDDFTREVINTEGWKSIGMFTFVGLGEEALFRGFLFPSFSSWLGDWGGALVSSTIFGFVHEGNRTENWFRTLSGMIFCWQLHVNQYKLGGNIFTHSWYDQVLVGPFVWQPEVLSGSKNFDFQTFRRRPVGLSVNIPL